MKDFMKKTIKITNEMLLKTYEILQKVSGTYNKRLSYAISLYKHVLTIYVNSLNDIIKPSEEYTEYDNRRYEIIRSYADIDNDGNMIIKNGAIKIRKDMFDLCKKAIDKLDDDHVDIIKKRKSDINEIDIVLRQEIEFDVDCICMDDIPEDIDQTLMDALLPIINREGSKL